MKWAGRPPRLSPEQVEILAELQPRYLAAERSLRDSYGKLRRLAGEMQIPYPYALRFIRGDRRPKWAADVLAEDPRNSSE